MKCTYAGNGLQHCRSATAMKKWLSNRVYVRSIIKMVHKKCFLFQRKKRRNRWRIAGSGG